MSEYYSFYIGKQNKLTNKISIVGPQMEGRLYAFYSRSRSFINGDEVMDAMTPIPISKIAENSLATMSIQDSHNKSISIAYEMPIQSIYKYANYGLVKGYVLLNDLQFLVTNKYSEDALDQIEILSPEVVSEMSQRERSKYKHMATVNTQSLGYICSLASELIEEYSLFGVNKNEEQLLLICTRA